MASCRKSCPPKGLFYRLAVVIGGHSYENGKTFLRKNSKAEHKLKSFCTNFLKTSGRFTQNLVTFCMNMPRKGWKILHKRRINSRCSHSATGIKSSFCFPFRFIPLKMLSFFSIPQTNRRFKIPFQTIWKFSLLYCSVLQLHSHPQPEKSDSQTDELTFCQNKMFLYICKRKLLKECKPLEMSVC